MASRIASDITAHILAVKAKVVAMGEYQGLTECHLFNMEYRMLRHVKLTETLERPLGRHIVMITGAAGAIGSAIAEILLDQVIGVPMAVTDSELVRRAFGAVVRQWSGVGLVVVNDGVAHVPTLANSM